MTGASVQTRKRGAGGAGGHMAWGSPAHQEPGPCSPAWWAPSFPLCSREAGAASTTGWGSDSWMRGRPLPWAVRPSDRSSLRGIGPSAFSALRLHGTSDLTPPPATHTCAQHRTSVLMVSHMPTLQSWPCWSWPKCRREPQHPLQKSSHPITDGPYGEERLGEERLRRGVHADARGEGTVPREAGSQAGVKAASGPSALPPWLCRPPRGPWARHFPAPPLGLPIHTLDIGTHSKAAVRTKGVNPHQVP